MKKSKFVAKNISDMSLDERITLADSIANGDDMHLSAQEKVQMIVAMVNAMNYMCKGQRTTDNRQRTTHNE